MNGIDKQAIVISRSLAGLLAGTLLRSTGWQVDIYQRSQFMYGSGRTEGGSR